MSCGGAAMSSGGGAARVVGTARQRTGAAQGRGVSSGDVRGGSGWLQFVALVRRRHEAEAAAQRTGRPCLGRASGDQELGGRQAGGEDGWFPLLGWPYDYRW